MQSTAGKRAQFTYTLRPLTEQDIPAYVDFINECASLEKVVDPTSLEEHLEWHHNPMNHDQQILALLTDDDGSEGRIIGCTDFSVHAPDTRLWGWMHVHPDYRNNGVGRALYGEFAKYAEEHEEVTEMIITPSREATCLVDFLTKRGHELERWFYDMQLPAEREVEPAVMPDGFVVHTFVPGQDEELLTDVRNRSFAEHYGSVPRTVEEMTYRTTLPDFHADGLFFAFDGDKAAGFCFTSRDPREWERRGEMVGHINLLGVVPEYRGRGLGRALLLQGVNYLRQYVSLVELGVEGKNDNALALYESVGFRLYKAWGNMIKVRRDEVG